MPVEPRPPQRFVVAYDAGPSSARIIATLVQEPLLRGAACILLTVGTGGMRQRELLAAAMRLHAAGYRVAELLEPGHVDEVILATVRATDADLLVMGAHSHSRIRELIIGATTTTLLRASVVPVLVIR